MELEDYLRLISAIRDTADALRQEADYVNDPDEGSFLRRRAESCDRRATQMERDLPEMAPEKRGLPRSQESFMAGSHAGHNPAQ